MGYGITNSAIRNMFALWLKSKRVVVVIMDVMSFLKEVRSQKSIAEHQPGSYKGPCSMSFFSDGHSVPF